MPSTMILETPKVIQRAWNDGLYNLRVKRNGNPRGHSIEEKVLYVLGLGYKYKGSTEVRDEEIRGSLNISLDGLTQDAKFIKIGQVLWEQCSPDFIAKMISSLSNINREQSIMYQSLAREEARNFKGYFNRRNTRAIKRYGLDPAAVLEQERKQMSSNRNLTERNRERLKAQRNAIFQSQLSSKGIEKRLVRFKASTKETRKLLNELGILLKTHDEYKNSIPEIAQDLGIQVESGFNKNYLIEEIKAVVVGYVESEVLHASAQRGSNSNVYIRVDTPKGIERIKSLLKYTSYSVLSAGDFITVDDLKQRNAEILRMRENAKAFLDKKGDINYKKLNKHLARRQKLEQTLYKIEGDVSAKGKKVSEADVISFYKFLTTTEMRSDDKQDTNILLPDTNDGVGFKFYNPLRDAGNDSLRPVEVEAFKAWHSQKKTDVEMARGFRGRYNEEEMSYINGPVEQRPFELNMPYLVAEGYSQDELLASMVHISNGMGLKAELNNITTTTDIPYGTVSFFMLGVLRRFVALEKLRKKRVWSLNPLGRKHKQKKRDKENLISEVHGKIAKNVAAGKGEAERLEFEVINGIYKPVMVSVDELRKWRDQMQPVYVMGGSIYTFGSGSGPAGESSPQKVKEEEERLNAELTGRKSRLGSYIGGDGKRFGRTVAYRDAVRGVNMGAFGTIEAPIYARGTDGKIIGPDQEFDFTKSGSREQVAPYVKKFIESKMYPELKGKIADIETSKLQPVFVVNKGFNTSNIEATALLNLLPKILGAIPLVGTGAAMLVDGLLQGEIDAAKSLPKFATGGSFTTNNSRVSQFIAGDSINNRINPEKITVDWARQRVNVQPLQNNVANVETGKITDPIIQSSPTVEIPNGDKKGTTAISVVNAVNPFDEEIKTGNITAKPMEVLVSLAESLVGISTILNNANQLSETHAALTAKAVDAINALAKMSGSGQVGSGDIFASLNKLARGD